MRKICQMVALAVLATCSLKAQQKVGIDWQKVMRVSQSTATLQVVTNPMLNRGSAIHDQSFAALKALGAEYVRYVPWLPYPKIAVAELEPPERAKLSWDFTYIDPVTVDFFQATEGHQRIVNFSTIPAWLFETEKPVSYPADANQVVWDYTQGIRLKDPTARQVGEYFARIVSWYSNGGFTDEYGQWHQSGHHYEIPIWEVLNEIESEHQTTPEDYTLRYDAIVAAIHKVSPKTKFMGLALAQAGGNPKYYEYFLDPKNHAPGTPIDYISFHFYASPGLDEGPDGWQHTFFNQADGFLSTTRFVLAIRDRLSPATKIDTDELGVILPTDGLEIKAGHALEDRIPKRYWNAAAALYAYLFAEEAKLGVDVIGESQLVGYPSQFPSVSMMNYNTGKPNARYWVLKLIKDNFAPGVTLVANRGEDVFSTSEVAVQGFLCAGSRKVLFVNKTNGERELELPEEFSGARMHVVDESSGDEGIRTEPLSGNRLKLAPFAVAVAELQ